MFIISLYNYLDRVGSYSVEIIILTRIRKSAFVSHIFLKAGSFCSVVLQVTVDIGVGVISVGQRSSPWPSSRNAKIKFHLSSASTMFYLTCSINVAANALN